MPNYFLESAMFVYSWILVGVLVLALFNCVPAVKTAPLFRIGFSLMIIGVGILPLSLWLFFIPSIALMSIGVILIVLYSLKAR